MSKTLEKGSFQDAVGTVVNAGTIEFVLSHDAMIIAGGQVAPTLVSATLTSTGDMPASFTILANDELTPNGTFYLTTVFDSNGARVFGPERWVFSGASPIDLDGMTPTIVDPAFADPLLNATDFVIAGTRKYPTIQEAVAAISSGTVEIVPGTYQEQVTLKSNVSLRGQGWGVIIKAPDSLSNTPQGVVQFLSAASNVHVSNLQIDGNKANQTAGNTVRGIYFVNATRCVAQNCYVHDTEDHGIMFSNSGTEEGNKILDNVVDAAGLNASTGGGSAIALSDCLNFIVQGNHGLNSLRAGFRIEGTGHVIDSNIAKANGAGGFVPVSTTSSRLVFSNNQAIDNVDAAAGDRTIIDGFRFVGTDDVVLTGNIASGNDGSGIHINNGSDNITITGNLCKNNGKGAAGSGIRIENPGGANSGITVSGNRCFDDQGTPTQDYGVTIENSSGNILVSGNDLRGNQTGALKNTAVGTSIRIDKSNLGLSSVVVSNATVAHTGDTNETTLKSSTITGNELGVKNGLRIIAQGTESGTAGTKTIKLKLGSTVLATITDGSAREDNWFIQAEVWNTATNAQRTITTVKTDDATTLSVPAEVTAAIDMATDTNIGLTVQLGNGADTADLRKWRIEPIL